MRLFNLKFDYLIFFPLDPVFSEVFPNLKMKITDGVGSAKIWQLFKLVTEHIRKDPTDGAGVIIRTFQIVIKVSHKLFTPQES